MIRFLVFCLVLWPAVALADGYPIGTPDTIFEGNNRIGAFRAWDKLFPVHNVARGKTVSDLPEGAPITLPKRVAGFLTRSEATGLIVLKDGAIRYEGHWLGADRRSRFTSMSLAKSFTSVLFGMALKDGLIKSVDDPLTDYLPDLKGSGYDGVPLSALLQMSSGVAFDEAPGSYGDALAFWTDTAVHHDTAMSAWAKRLPQAKPPFSTFKYNGVDSAVLGLVVMQATGKTLAEYFSEKIWQPAGMEDDASWGLDGAGKELPYCCVNARLRDYARLGRFLMEDESLKPWMVESSKPHRSSLAPGQLYPGYPLGYGYQWWLAEDGYMGHGANGQFLYLDPKRKLVIVLTSAWASPWDYGLEYEAYDAFVGLAQAVK